MYMSERFDAVRALDLGLVNEVHAADQLQARAWEIAESLMRVPRITRRATHAIVQRPWRRMLVDDLGYGLATELFGIAAPRPRG
jgi:enoyl-CoA hydratase/carnithine racemase